MVLESPLMRHVVYTNTTIAAWIEYVRYTCASRCPLKSMTTRLRSCCPAFTAQTVPTRWGTSGLVVRALKSGTVISIRGCGSVLRLVAHVKEHSNGQPKVPAESCSAHYTVCSASWCHVLLRSATHMRLAAVTHGHQIQCAELGHDNDDGGAHITCHWLSCYAG